MIGLIMLINSMTELTSKALNRGITRPASWAQGPPRSVPRAGAGCESASPPWARAPLPQSQHRRACVEKHILNRPEKHMYQSTKSIRVHIVYTYAPRERERESSIYIYIYIHIKCIYLFVPLAINIDCTSCVFSDLTQHAKKLPPASLELGPPPPAPPSRCRTLTDRMVMAQK